VLFALGFIYWNLDANWIEKAEVASACAKKWQAKTEA
jgi:hypothetical protein